MLAFHWHQVKVLHLDRKCKFYVEFVEISENGKFIKKLYYQGNHVKSADIWRNPLKRPNIPCAEAMCLHLGRNGAELGEET